MLTVARLGPPTGLRRSSRGNDDCDALWEAFPKSSTLVESSSLLFLDIIGAND